MLKQKVENIVTVLRCEKQYVYIYIYYIYIYVIYIYIIYIYTNQTNKMK